MNAPMLADVRLAIDTAREGDAMVPVHQVASALAEAFHDEGGLIKLMLARVVMTECAKAGYAMRLTIDQ